MPIRRKKVDEETDEEEGISADVVPPPHNAGLGEELTKSPSLSYDVAPLIATVEAELDMAKNDAGVNEVSQMLAIALQQIDTVIEETGRGRSSDLPQDYSDDVKRSSGTNVNSSRDVECLSAAESTTEHYVRNMPEVNAVESLPLKSSLSSSSSSESSNSGESTTSDLGIIMENEELLTPTSPMNSMDSSAHVGPSSAPSTARTSERQDAIFDSSLSTVFVQQLSLRLAETLNRLSMDAARSNYDAMLPSHPPTLPKPDRVVAHVLLRWLRPYDETRSPSPSMSTASCPEYVDLQDKLHRLETDRESLSLQVSVLSEQVGAQSDKIKDLESLLDDKRRKLDSTEEMLQDELSTRSGLETDRLDLLSEVSQLKLKLASLERDKISTEHKLRTAQGEIHGLQRVMQERYHEFIAQSQQQPTCPPHVQFPNATVITKPLITGVDQAGEIEQLRSTVQHLISENVEKEQQIEQMRLLMERQLLRSTPLSSNSHSNGLGSDVDNVGTSLTYNHRSGSFGNGTMMGTSALSGSVPGNFYHPQHIQHVRHAQQQQPVDLDINRQLRQLLAEDDNEVQQIGAASASLPTSASFPESISYNSRPPPYPSSYAHGIGAGLAMQPSASYTSNLTAASIPVQPSGSVTNASLAVWSAPVTPHHQQSINGAGKASQPSTAARQLAAELDELIPQYRRSPLGFYHMGSLPRNVGQGLSSLSKKKSEQSVTNSGECRPTTRQPKRGLKWLLHFKTTSKRSTSAPNLGRLEDADEECHHDEAMESDEEGKTPSQIAGERFKRDKKQKSLRNLISKLKRSNSQEFGNGGIGDGDFRRGGFIRATAGPRLRSWSREPKCQRSVPIRPSIEQFGKWTSEEVADWLNEIGLTMYVADCRRNIRSGRHMMSLAPMDMEKELGIKNQLHRKKLIVAMRNIELGKSEPSDQMDYHQVLRWLDDVGLPQYRDIFAEHRVDGALLNLLTVDDLLQMRINSALHHATVARGIQILRNIGFNLNRFIRKFNPEVIGKGPLPSQVQLWSQHCVTEWLRTIDLTEFTPNLMCAGIHGALMVLEPTFTAESLAAVLQIPTQKTLLRRHLTTHFNQLIGQDVVAAKREALSAPFAVQLVPGLKVKAGKKGFSLARRKHSRTEIFMEPDDLVCPLTPNRKPPSSAALLERLPESISEQMLHNLASSNV